ncbi:MAG: hypothetical protein KAJ19_16600 [Gammaproteobacteria bacterium]|nr:hypothetical protein [Gammaproteobacteria bacterium]
MRIWILFAAFWLAEAIAPGMVYAVKYEVASTLLFGAGGFFDFVEFMERKK